MQTDIVETSKFASVSELSVTAGTPVAVAANEPLSIDDPSSVWHVESGELDVFLVEVRDGRINSRLSHLLSVGPGGLIFGVTAKRGSLTLIAKGQPGSRIRHLESNELKARVHTEALAEHVDSWITDFAATVASNIDPRPRASLLLSEDHTRDCTSGSVVSAPPGGVVWAQTSNGGSYLSTEAIDSQGSGLVPLTSDTWLTNDDDVTLSGVSSKTLESGQLLQALQEFHQMALSAERLNRSLQVADTANQQVERVAHHKAEKKSARRLLFGVLNPSRITQPTEGSPLTLVLEAIGRHEQIEFRLPKNVQDLSEEPPSLQEILQECGVRHRRIRLTPEDRWWRGDSGSLLAFRQSDRAPVALLPSIFRNIREFDPVSRGRRRVRRSQAKSYEDDAWMFYRSYPEDRRLTTRDMIKFCFRKAHLLILILMIAGLLTSFQLVGVAFLSSSLADALTPPIGENAPIFFTIILAGLAVIATLLLMLQGVIALRLEGLVTSRIASGLMGHVLNLPLSFFRRLRAGDLMTRTMGLWTLRDQLSSVLTHIVLANFFLLLSFGMLFLYDATLAIVSIVIGVTAIIGTIVIGIQQLNPQRERLAFVRDMAGKLNQYIGGINKLRSAGAEDSAFASWARDYRDQLLAREKSDLVNRHLIAFTSAMPALGGAVLIILTLSRDNQSFDIAHFVVAYIVTTIFLSTVTNLGIAFELIMSSLTTYQQIKPMISERPTQQSHDMSASRGSVKLNGDIRFDSISFRYNEGDPMILNDVSLHVRPGEFVAIVGPSGAGKSTLFRLALGLEEPLSGAVYFDRRDLVSLSNRSVRRQIGVVSQDSALQPGNILQNIVGLDGDLTIDDAWRAAKLAGVDEDIAAMPMQMFTPVGDSVSTFSGGQMQRIQIAGALVRNPQIIFLDEATSWLDSKTQERVMEGIESLSASRIVIAHRLSTVRHADHIYVLSDGRIVQHGTFDELSDVDGIFRSLIQRQIA